MTFLTLHHWTARLAVLQAVVHSICYTMEFFEPGVAEKRLMLRMRQNLFYVCMFVVLSFSC